MKKVLFLICGCLFVFSCNEKETKNSNTLEVKDSLKSSSFQMYEMSEMAALMEQMYAYNLQLKEQILNQETLGTYPKSFDRLHSAELTDASDRDAFFNEQAYLFIDAQKAIYEAEDPKKQFNSMVNQCLECHTKKCGGPIPRIKKLIIP